MTANLLNGDYYANDTGTATDVNNPPATTTNNDWFSKQFPILLNAATSFAVAELNKNTPQLKQVAPVVTPPPKPNYVGITIGVVLIAGAIGGTIYFLKHKKLKK